MLSHVMNSINNYFVRTVEHGTFTISGGVITVHDTYLVGQHIRIMGSLLNDGVFEVKNTLISIPGAGDETFTGAVCGLAVPADFLELVEQITAFQSKASKNPAAGMLQSESFGGYAYSVATGANGLPATWKEAFATRLNPYRRMHNEVIL